MDCEKVVSKGDVASSVVRTLKRIHSGDASRTCSWLGNFHALGGAGGLIFRRSGFCFF
jgi:hypothetical protein